jgi:hypothetical protein
MRLAKHLFDADPAPIMGEERNSQRPAHWKLYPEGE